MLLDLPFSRSELDRAAHLRTNSLRLEQMWDVAKIAHLRGEKFEVSGAGAGALQYLRAGEIGAGERYFLGLDTKRVPFFLWHETSNDEGEGQPNFKTLREIGAGLNSLDIGVAVHSLALGQWHLTHTHCSRCGSPTVSDLGGSIRICTVDQTQHHPRTDPAIIVLVKDSADRILLGHQKIWPTNRYSTLAGFVEPGESFESCVTREVFEEARVVVKRARYLGSQPWPFPASIMIAYEVDIDNPEQARPDGEEIESIKWLTRAELKSATESGEVILPPLISIARAMINAWYGPNAKTELRGGEAWRS